jgi:Carbon-nitrogen hydrolase
VPDVVTPENPVSAYVHMALAHVNSLFVVCADQCGIDRGCTFLGRSCIAGPSGFVAGPARFESPEIVVAEINLAKARYHNWTSLANPFADRRTDLFDHELGYRHPQGAEIAFQVRPGRDAKRHAQRTCRCLAYAWRRNSGDQCRHRPRGRRRLQPLVRQDHLPQVLACPGFVSGTRYECTAGEPCYLAIYELETENALTTPEMQRVRGWGEMFPFVRNFHERVYRKIVEPT